MVPPAAPRLTFLFDCRINDNKFDPVDSPMILFNFDILEPIALRVGEQETVASVAMTMVISSHQLVQTQRERRCVRPPSLLLGRIDRWSGREIDGSQTKRLGRSCLSIACSAHSLARSTQAERDNE
ncbi:hypothetical protein EVAR_98189_1 [Eumeta japonica]|uniref:Uncharacterized protein n=1 Tax=Eumeta variegata TaxID=151549 RepID=A0A4C2A4L4_EUMVA|nr:hypothetical protein EVAR_98189_1 [Eumeta japonica]